MGADTLVNPQHDSLDGWKAEKGYFDISFEVSGHPSSISTCLEVTRAKGVMVQVGMGGAVPNFPMMMLISKEISLKGSFRFTTEFNTAVSACQPRYQSAAVTERGISIYRLKRR